jgi:nitroreductase
MNQTFLSQLNWRFATKKFDKNKKLDKDTLDQIIEAIRMTPTSLGLQTFHTYVITDQKVKDEIKDNSYSQSQVADASHLLVMCYRTDGVKRVDQYSKLVTKGKLVEKVKIKPMEAMMKGFIKSKSEEDIANWSSRQVYIALGFAMAACAELGVDSCPMEGFDHAAIDKILDLPENMKSVLLLPVGYRKEDPNKKKIRFSNEDLFTYIK